jgi:hypothetical protein
MTAAEFRRMALALPEAVVASHLDPCDLISCGWATSGDSAHSRTLVTAVSRRSGVLSLMI